MNLKIDKCENTLTSFLSNRKKMMAEPFLESRWVQQALKVVLQILSGKH